MLARSIAFLIWTISACALAAEPPTNSEPIQLAQQAVELAEASNTADLAALFHYPPTYSQGEREEDIAGIASLLSFIFSEFGKPAGTRTHTDPASYYEVGLFGSTIPYWESLSPFHTEQFVYSTSFSNAGSGFLIINIFKHNQSEIFEVQSFGVALSETSTAKEKVIDLMIRGYERDGKPLPPGFRDTLETQLQLSTTSGKSNP